MAGKYPNLEEILRSDREHGIASVPAEAREKALKYAIGRYRFYREDEKRTPKVAYQKTWNDVQRAGYGVRSQFGYFISYAHHIGQITAEAQEKVEAELPPRKRR